MSDTLIKAADITESVEAMKVQYAEQPIPFERFLDLTYDTGIELINGVLVEKPMVQLTHEKLLLWLLTMLHLFTRQRDLGVVFGSRTAVEINAFGGRLPDLLFVRKERSSILQERAVYGAPDLVIELVSPNDRPSGLIALETDYRSIGVPEIVFIDQQKKRVRVIRKRDDDYEETILTEGTLSLESIAGFHIEIAWLWQDPRPNEMETVVNLLAQSTTS